MASTEHAVQVESTDIEPRPVLLTGLGILVSALVVAAIVYGTYAMLIRAREREGAEHAAAAIPTQLPPEPRLQASPRADFQSYRAAQMGQLSSYYWVDRGKGVIAIPIQRAMDLVAQRGIPPRKAPADLKLYPPQAGTRLTGFEGKVEPEPR